MCGGEASQTSAPQPQSMSSTSPHPTGFGSHTVYGPFCSLFTQIDSASSQYVQSGTQSHASAGTHMPVQHDASTSTDATSVPSQSGGSPSHVTPVGLQSIFTNVQRPNRHCTSAPLSPANPQAVPGHSGRSHSGGCSPGPIGSHEQQSSASAQSESTTHGTASAPPELEPVSPELPVSPAVDSPTLVVVVATLVGSVDVDVAPPELLAPPPVDVPAVVPPVVGSPLPVVGPAVVVAFAVVVSPAPPHAASASPTRTMFNLQRKESIGDF